MHFLLHHVWADSCHLSPLKLRRTKQQSCDHLNIRRPRGIVKFALRDRRIIQVGENDAVWDVVAFQVEGEAQPTRLEARCHLKLGHQEFTIDGSHIDSRPARTPADFDESQAEFLKISQSFRLDRSDAPPRPK